MKLNSRDVGSYLTVAQGAAELGVHPSTIRRWIDQGLLPAFRLGEKRIVIDPFDLAAVVAPHRGRPGRGQGRGETGGARRLTPAEQDRGFRALAEMERLGDELAAKYGTFTPESWELLNASRDERTRDLLGPDKE